MSESARSTVATVSFGFPAATFPEAEAEAAVCGLEEDEEDGGGRG